MCVAWKLMEANGSLRRLTEADWMRFTASSFTFTCSLEAESADWSDAFQVLKEKVYKTPKTCLYRTSA